MTLPTYCYVDPSIAGNSGTGTIGDPYGDLQYALDTETQDTTNGNQFNIKAGTAEVLAAVLGFATFGTPNFAYGCIFKGYTSVANDGGLFEIDANGGACLTATNGCAFIDGEIHNGGTTGLLTFGSDGYMQNVEVHDTANTAITSTSRNVNIVGCYIHDIGGIGVKTAYSVRNCYFANGAKSFTVAIDLDINSLEVVGNIISISGDSDGIDITSRLNSRVIGNSVLSSGGTGAGIVGSSTTMQCIVMNNLVEGFSGTLGAGIYLVDGRINATCQNNAMYNNTTNLTIGDEWCVVPTDNESLGASPFAKSGADTFANRFVYFAPVDTGNVHGGAYVG